MIVIESEMRDGTLTLRERAMLEGILKEIVARRGLTVIPIG